MMLIYINGGEIIVNPPACLHKWRVINWRLNTFVYQRPSSTANWYQVQIDFLWSPPCGSKTGGGFYVDWTFAMYRHCSNPSSLFPCCQSLKVKAANRMLFVIVWATKRSIMNVHGNLPDRFSSPYLPASCPSPPSSSSYSSAATTNHLVHCGFCWQIQDINSLSSGV